MKMSFRSPCKDLPIPLILPRLQGCEGIVGYETGKLLQLLKLVAEAVAAAAAAAVSAVDLHYSAATIGNWAKTFRHGCSPYGCKGGVVIVVHPRVTYTKPGRTYLNPNQP